MLIAATTAPSASATENPFRVARRKGCGVVKTLGPPLFRSPVQHPRQIVQTQRADRGYTDNAAFTLVGATAALRRSSTGTKSCRWCFIRSSARSPMPLDSALSSAGGAWPSQSAAQRGQQGNDQRRGRNKLSDDGVNHFLIANLRNLDMK